MTASALFGLLSLGALPWVILMYRKKKSLEQLEQSAQENQTQQVLLEERFNNVSLQFEQTQSALNQAKTQIQFSDTELATLRQTVKNKDESLLNLEQQSIKLQQQLEFLREENTQLKTTLAKLDTEYNKAQESYAEKLALLDEAKTKLGNEFKLLANQIFEEKQSRMTASSKETLDAIIKPMQKDMSDFRSRIEQVHKEDTEARSSLERHLSHLKELNQQMSIDATNLTQALKSDSKVQGNWGELILEKLLESSGLREGFEFVREKSYKNDEGQRQRPDVIINMPGKKHVIIDAKVSLTDYERAMSATAKPEKEAAIKAHVKSLQSHIQLLAAKEYNHIHEINSPDYVLMFVPIEGAYLMAIEADSRIFEAAFDKNIAVVTPSTLYATLKLVEQLWRYEKQSGNVAKLTKQAGNLHDKFVIFANSFKDIDTHLGRAQKSFDNALGQLKDGRGNLVSQVKTLADLSGKAKKELPDYLLDDFNSESANLEEDIGET